MKQQLHRLLDLVLEAKERGIKLNFSFNTSVELAMIFDEEKLMNSDYSFHHMRFNNKYGESIEQLIELTEEYIKNYGQDTLQEAPIVS